MLFCIELCASVLYYALLYWIMFFWIVLCFSVLNYGKVNYAYVISFMALSECHDLTPDNNLVTKKKKVGTSLVYLNHAYFVVSLSSFWTNPVITIHL